ncbi:HD-GYP domain-containing protein [Pseudodesulfovibrio indicus]|jgi:HD-GYP domain-containing protein (c-di-GMP phosphodiesterase class II)|uniref:HD-GYP domain-containing protein (C-di-GMP phosphodiesterase class II) n=1 Tax=Pseudodesulfovibrio indicus TaxID=1716143 RepID=A0A126QLE5_9BACT|nr:HD-GYP domain-containing protein [Pseudodesulfovibrio indicus]AMK10498.1 metal-dependent phosphohydrolase [Pseudodesulfovibrio indicus]TDT89103.1 HD-GYP domain-containing protein (c-di-GMP phosphodiesterase class II) [Pseudodesulfovibrio indicus]
MIKKISIEELEPGMEVVQVAHDMWQRLPYLYMEPGIIESEEEVARLLELGYKETFVALDDGEGMTDEERLNELIAGRDHDREQKPRVPFHQALGDAMVTYEDAMAHAMHIVRDAKLGRKMDYATSLETASAIVESAVSNPDTLVCLAKLSDFDDYTYTHSINVAAIAVVFGEYIGMSREELILLGVSGMMHDLGKTTVPAAIINKPGRLSKAECEEIKRHPAYGRTILQRNGDIPTQVLEAVKHHHEKYNGSGYPGGLVRKDIPAFARILCLADVYDALTSDRCYKQAILPNKALGIMYGMRDQDFDPMEVQLFIKCLGIFPAGSFVRLNTGEYALVFESNSSQPLTPKIRIVMDQAMNPIQTRDVDLMDQEEPPSRIEIVDCADPSAYRKNLLSYLSGN